MTELTRDQVRLSRRMSLVLRHRPETAGLTLDANGWVPVPAFLAALGISREDLDVVVAENDKKRFAIAPGPDGVDRIRASQGHSRRVGIDLELPPATPPAELFHGTPRANTDAILKQGLRPGSRHHVHLSADVPTALVVGRRRSPDVVVFSVAAGLMADEGHVFHRSDNGVWLTAFVPSPHLSIKRTNP
ncbi:putative RNA 2'-phosphotransferase [Actinoplanes lutulentus]|uniref:Probable RNA 2'-phosphotransferase n=1 Tax=Actinoplanes lutulentus TaxID=1287878 RepID=A0A327Z9S8_9ACTN|nr:RNA 2'-phosphotransferase [Actinoplanes lutulentus]MBB2944939.1 putative RNA 2'-phosphotransferase [Actinoplanes lutulentus]RAK35273.1 putative RNA 2'-phosphotransferase [Actinoplanes lutulentus]